MLFNIYTDFHGFWFKISGIISAIKFIKENNKNILLVDSQSSLDFQTKIVDFLENDVEKWEEC